MLQISLFVIAFLLVILVLSYYPARRLLLSSLNSLIAIWLTLLILAAFIASFIFFGNLGWRYMKPTFHGLAISTSHKLQKYLILMQNEKGTWIIYLFAILAITVFFLLIIILIKKIEKLRDKEKKINFPQKNSRKK